MTLFALPQRADHHEDPGECALQWLAAFNAGLSSGDPQRVAETFRQDGTWRDMLALDWRVESIAAAALPDRLVPHLLKAGLTNARLRADRTAPVWLRRADVDCIELFFEFDHTLGRGEGIARVIPEPDGRPFAWHVFTYLDQLDGFEETTGTHRPKHGQRGSVTRAKYSGERQPEVLVIGSGQAGLSLAARLSRMGVDTLVTERNASVGQNWRDRYEALALHNAITMINLPYMQFPQTWPKYLPKERIADWLEFYADAMDLDVWTDCTVRSCEYDRANKTWVATLQHGDAAPISITCKHVVVATGVSGKPKMPPIAGLSDFGGEIIHSSNYRDGADARGRKALVFGTGASGHDIAQDLHAFGADVTLVQRGSMSVCSVEPGSATVLDALFGERDNEEADLIVASMPYEARVRTAQIQTARLQDIDAQLYAGLEKIGFKLDFGDDNTGIAMKYPRQGGGFYLNGGCSELLIEGAIGLLQADRIERFVKRGVQLTDGAVLDAELVVMATGYEAQSAVNRRLLGDEITDRVGPVWGVDAQGEQRNAWRRTAQPGLWFMLGNFQQCRFYSKTLALQICADLRGLAPGGPTL